MRSARHLRPAEPAVLHHRLKRRRAKHNQRFDGSAPLAEVSVNLKPEVHRVRLNFLEEILEWRHSPEGEQFAELADALCNLMEDVQLDAKQRKFIWPDGQRLDLDQSVQHIQKQYPEFRRDWIEKYLIDWIDMDYAPEHYSEAQLDELDKLTARWIADHVRRAKISKRQERTRHS